MQSLTNDSSKKDNITAKHRIPIGTITYPYFILLFAIWILYCRLYSKQLVNNEAAISLSMRAVLFLLLGYGCYLAFQRKLTIQKVTLLCILGGLVLRIGYTYYTPYYVRLFDLGEISDAGNGHAAYIYNLFYHHKLPASYDYQFYHPPLFHILAALNMKLFSKLYPTADAIVWFEAAKLVSCFASCCALLLIRRICQELKCTPEMTCLTTGLMAFYPNFYLQAGRINNDATATAFMMLAILMLIKWYHSRHFSQLIGMALGIGLGMMTKLNVAILAFVAGPVMLYVLWQAIQKKKWKMQLTQYVAFLAVCAPLGLWYSIRNFILFKQPLGYVHDLDANGPSWLYRGNYSLTQRFFSFPWDQYKENVYASSGRDYNLPLYLLRSSLFSEFSFENMDGVARMLTHINIILILLSLIAMVVIIWKGTKFSPALRYGCGFLWLIMMISYFMFNIKYPDSCTMDFRYIVPTAISGTIYLSAFWQQLHDYSLEKTDDLKHILAKVMVWIIPACCTIFILLSAYMFSNLS